MKGRALQHVLPGRRDKNRQNKLNNNQIILSLREQMKNKNTNQMFDLFPFTEAIGKH